MSLSDYLLVSPWYTLVLFCDSTLTAAQFTSDTKHKPKQLLP